MSQQQRAAWIEDLRRAPERMAALAARCPVGDVARRPAPDAFSVREIVHHLRDIEIEGHGARLVRLLSETDPDLPGVEGDRLARERRYNDRPHEAALEEFRRSRLGSVARLEGLRPDEWARSGTLAGIGPVSVERLVEIWSGHDREHLEEMSRLVEPGTALL